MTMRNDDEKLFRALRKLKEVPRLPFDLKVFDLTTAQMLNKLNTYSADTENELYFITLTIKDFVASFNRWSANHLLRFIKWLTKHEEIYINYFITCEYTLNGQPHFHGVVKAKNDRPMKMLARYWRVNHGFVKIEKVRNYTGVSNYIIKDVDDSPLQDAIGLNYVSDDTADILIRQLQISQIYYKQQDSKHLKDPDESMTPTQVRVRNWLLGLQQMKRIAELERKQKEYEKGILIEALKDERFRQEQETISDESD